MKLSSHGAAQGVTGSCHLLEAGDYRILVDCGLFQGSRELHEENGADFGFDAASIDVLLLTHAHLDHCGRLPLLVKRGFRGEVIATAATCELARLVLLDAAHLQEEEARRRTRLSERQGKTQADGPLYTIVDAMDGIGRFGRAASYRRPIELRPGIRATFFDAGHILGSASVLIESDDQGARHRILFSGDIGNAGRPLLRPPEPPGSADTVVMETTYGDRQHRPFDASVLELYEAINTTIARGGNVLIPTFALERAQEILFVLRRGMDENRLPPSIPVFLDSPMAISATQIFERHPDAFTAPVLEMFKSGNDPFHLPGLRLTREVAESLAINRITGGAIIMAGAGMCTGGRIRHHLRHNLWRPQASVVFVGYNAAGTLGRRLVEGAKQVQLFDEDIAVKARIFTVNGFSAHADQTELLQWQDSIAEKRTVVLVHGEVPAMRAFAGKLSAPRVLMPRLGEEIALE